MSDLLFAALAALRVFFRSRLNTSLEILALRHQVAVLKRKRGRARLTWIDRLFWIALQSAWSRWSDALVIAKPATVIAWHRAGFRLYWRWRSRSRGGRPRVSHEIKTLIRRMRSENAGWGAPKIHGELLKLGFQISERTVGRYLRRLRPRHSDSSQNWLAFLSNHREVLVAFDFFTAPTLTFKLLYYDPQSIALLHDLCTKRRQTTKVSGNCVHVHLSSGQGLVGGGETGRSSAHASSIIPMKVHNI